ncbi:MAG: bifunctional phosphopantothenoylcysteine decarboxylase/phosphopantothenate--cysteine ligase CoaBC [Bdellovibrionales bacterium]|nr:bifunctional phosphopantothenoylcysteine decarboxylase/phosphopantothenate--cysteine ligase CoaBC [Bdellovibrionales bacterium]
MVIDNEKRNIVIGVTGSVAAYKAVELTRMFISRGYLVKIVMTESAKEFVGSSTFSSITGTPVSDNFWNPADGSAIEHIELADWADVFLIAPATADVIAKLAYGMADSPVLAAALACKSPIVVAPAMNVNMFENPATQANLKLLKSRNVQIVEPGVGELACGWNGAGRLADLWEIFYRVRRSLSPQDFKGKKVLITAGPTHEPLDPIRLITNRSSGKMGSALALEAYCRGAEITLIHGPIKLKLPESIKQIKVNTAVEMHDAVLANSFDAETQPDVIIMSAAVADFRPSEVHKEKIKKSSAAKVINLEPNPDILKILGDRRGADKKPILVGFALETGEVEDLILEVRRKLNEKHVDIVVGNHAEDSLDHNTNRVWILDKDGKQGEIATAYKSRVAAKILDAVNRI